MDLKDNAAIMVSAAALILSGISAYFSHFYASYSIEAVILRSEMLGRELDVSLAIINHGTKRVILTKAYIYEKSEYNILNRENPCKAFELESKTPRVIVLYGEDPYKAVELKPKLPMIIEPNDVAEISFHGQIDLPALYQRGSIPETNDGRSEFNGVPTRFVNICASRPYNCTE